MLRGHVSIVSQNTFYFLVNLFLDGRKSRQIIQPPQSSVRCLHGKEAKKKYFNFSICARWNLTVSLPLSSFSIFRYWSRTLRRVFRRASCNALRWHQVNTIRRVCIAQNFTVVSFNFIWINRSITLIRAETQRYVIGSLFNRSLSDFLLL